MKTKISQSVALVLLAAGLIVNVSFGRAWASAPPPADLSGAPADQPAYSLTWNQPAQANSANVSGTDIEACVFPCRKGDYRVVASFPWSGHRTTTQLVPNLTPGTIYFFRARNVLSGPSGGASPYTGTVKGLVSSYEVARPRSVPVLPNSVFNQRIPSNPHIAPNSADIVQYYVDTWNVGGSRNLANQQDKYAHGINYSADPQHPGAVDQNKAAIYFASVHDPVFTIRCFMRGCENKTVNGLKIHIPTNAKWQHYPNCSDVGAGYSQKLSPYREQCHDDHLVIITPDRLTEIDLFQAYGCFQNGSDCVVGLGEVYNLATTDGFAGIGGPGYEGSSTATHAAVTAGLVTADDLLAGSINHALEIDWPCGDGTFVAPAHGSDGPAQSCQKIEGLQGRPRSDSPNMLAEGQRVFLDVSPAEIQRWPVPAHTKAIATALALYGAYFADSGIHTGVKIQTVNSLSFAAPNGVQNLWPQLAARHSMRRNPEEWAQNVDLGLDQIPGGWTKYLKVCARNGC